MKPIVRDTYEPTEQWGETQASVCQKLQFIAISAKGISFLDFCIYFNLCVDRASEKIMKMREKPLPLPSNMRKINNKSTASSFLSTGLQLLLFHDPVGHRWSWRPLRVWPPDWGAKCTITTATGCLWGLNKTTKMPLSWRSSQVLPVCSRGRAGFAHQPSEPGSCSSKGTGLWPLGSGDEPE